MTGAWLSVDIAAAAAGSLLAVLVIRRWLRWLPPFSTAGSAARAYRECALISVGAGMIPLTTGLIVMWRAPATAGVSFGGAGSIFTLTGWWAGSWLRVRGSAGRGPAPTGRD